MALLVAVPALAAGGLVVVVVALLLSADTDSDRPSANACIRFPADRCLDGMPPKIDDVRQYRDYPIYWIGESFEGLPLTTLATFDGPHWRSGERRREVTFDYGRCKIVGGAEGCAIPLTVSSYPFCEVPFDISDLLASERTVREATVHSDQAGQHVLVWSGEVVVLIQAGKVDQADRAVDVVVRLNVPGTASAAESLGPPLKADCAVTRSY